MWHDNRLYSDILHFPQVKWNVRKYNMPPHTIYQQVNKKHSRFAVCKSFLYVYRSLFRPFIFFPGWWLHVILFLSRRKYVAHNRAATPREEPLVFRPTLLTLALCRAPHHRTCHFNLARPVICTLVPSPSRRLPSLFLVGSVNFRKAAWKMKRKAIKPKTTRRASKQPKAEGKKQWRWAAKDKTVTNIVNQRIRISLTKKISEIWFTRT